MKIPKLLFQSIVLVIMFTSPAVAEMSTQLGIGYGKELRGNKDLAQYEIFWRQPLSYNRTLDDGWQISSAIEIGMALLKDSDSDADDSETGRFSLMPQLVLSPNNMVNFIFGFGAGFMAGETEFEDHNLGGSFLLASKIGMQLIFAEHWGVEATFYHQSNAGIYEYNASLNMIHLAFAYNF